MTADELDKRQAIIDACRRMNALGINQGTSGNISVRHGAGLLVTPTSVPYDAMTPDQIVSHIPTITLADVHSALAYYFDHVQEIQDEIRADRQYADEFFRENPSLLDAKLKQEQLKEVS